MPRIYGLGEIDWTGTNTFSLREHLEMLDQEYWNLIDDAISHCYNSNEKAANLASRAHDVATERSKNRLPLTIRIWLEQPLDLSQLPSDWQSEHNGTGTYVWMVLPTDYTPPAHPIHPVIDKLAQKSEQEVNVRLYADMRVMDVNFYWDYDIRKPTRYLQTLAEQMTRWAS